MGTWPFPGYEPKRFTGQMSEFHRRRATKEEMEQGQKEIRLADERMKTEAESRVEMPIQNGPEEKPEDVVEGETSPPKEGKRDEPQRGTLQGIPIRVQVPKRCCRLHNLLLILLPFLYVKRW